VGTVTESNLLASVLNDALRFDKSVEQTMESPLPEMHMNEELQEAVKFFTQKMPAVIVKDDTKPIGILTRFDVLEYMSH
jgi:predicted transcriptional regulator